MTDPPSDPRESAEFLRSKLLPLTLLHAVSKVPFYNEKPYLREAAQCGRIEEFPLQHKEAIRADLIRYQDGSLTTALRQHTSGTSGRPFVVERSPEEVEFIARFFEEFRPPNSEAVAPLCISLMGRFHGDAIPIPYPGTVLAPDVMDCSNIAELAQKQDGNVSPVIIVGLESQIRILTLRLASTGFDFNKSSVRMIYSTGDHLTPRLRSFYRHYWKLNVQNRYSLTECFGGASECAHCGLWHMDPNIVAEVVNPMTHKLVTAGFGLLVITCLYPFIQKQPLIRYVTGDLVETTDTQCPSGSFGFRLKGRASKAVMLERPDGCELLLSGSDLYDVVDDFPEVASSVMFPRTPDISDHSSLGHLKLAVESTKAPHQTNITIRFETRFDPLAYPHATRALCAKIRRRILSKSVRLRNVIEERGASLSVLASSPGSLSSFMPDEVE